MQLNKNIAPNHNERLDLKCLWDQREGKWAPLKAVKFWCDLFERSWHFREFGVAELHYLNNRATAAYGSHRYGDRKNKNSRNVIEMP